MGKGDPAATVSCRRRGSRSAVAGLAAVVLMAAAGAVGGGLGAPGAAARATGASAPPPLAEDEVQRLSGADRWATGADLARTLWPQGAGTVLLATGLDYPDALAGAPVAAVEDAPLLLTPPDRLAESVRRALLALEPAEVVLLGGTGALSADVADEVAELPGAPDVRRLAGEHRFETAQAAADAAGAAAETTTAVATASDFPDALAAGSLMAGDAPVPVALAGDATVRAPLADAGRALLIGGPGALGPAVAEDARGESGAVQRLAGADRWATSRQVADFALAERLQGRVPLVVATGQDFPDALTAGAAAARVGGPLLLVPTAGPTDQQIQWLVEHRDRLSGAWVVGGPSAVSGQAVEAIRSALVRGWAGGAGQAGEAGGSGPTTESDGADAASAGAATEPALLGEALTLATRHGGRVRVAPQAVHDPATPARDREGSDDGARFVAVELTIANVGGTSYRDSPVNSGVLVDAAGTTHEPRITRVHACHRLDSVAISPGDRRRGCLVFEVADGRDASRFRFTPGSGFGPQTGAWDVTARSEAPHDPGEPAGPADAVPVGEPVALTSREGLAVEATVEAVHRRAPAADGYDDPAPGHRYVAVELTLANRGDARYEDAPTNGGVLVDDRDVAYSARIVEVDGCQRLPTVAVPPGGQRSGCLVFEVPAARRPRLFQFATDTGLGPTVAEWRLRAGEAESRGRG